MTKPVHTELNQYFANIRGKTPIFGYPVITFGVQELARESKWSMISSAIISPDKNMDEHHHNRIFKAHL